MKNLKKGFTLIEVIIVVAIISILSYVFFPKIILEIRKATVANVKHDLGVIRESLEFDANLKSEFPDLVHENGKNNSKILDKYRVLPTPGFVDSKGVHYHETSRVFDKRTNEGGWYYIREEGLIFANLPNGAYTKDPVYEVWETEPLPMETLTPSVIPMTNLEPAEIPMTDLQPAVIPMTNLVPSKPLVNWDKETKGSSTMVGSSGRIYQFPWNSGKYVVDVRPNVGWLSNGQLTGKYYIYIDDKLVHSDKATVNQNGKSSLSSNIQQNIESLNSKAIKVAFEYKTPSGETKLIYGEKKLTK